jgi:hypothetical protein
MSANASAMVWLIEVAASERGCAQAVREARFGPQIECGRSTMESDLLGPIALACRFVLHIFQHESDVRFFEVDESGFRHDRVKPTRPE